MGFFNDKLRKALFTGSYICSECSGRMIFENKKWRDTLVCLSCGNSMDLDEYGLSSEEEYSNLYPTEKDIVGCDDDESETYEDVYGDSDDN